MDGNIPTIVPVNIFHRIFKTPFVNINCIDFGSAAHFRQNSEDCSTTAHIEDSFFLEIIFENKLKHHKGCFVVASAEGHFWFDYNLVFKIPVCMKWGADGTFSIDLYWVKILLPFQIPVDLFYFRKSKRDVEFIRT